MKGRLKIGGSLVLLFVMFLFVAVSAAEDNPNWVKIGDDLTGKIIAEETTEIKQNGATLTSENLSIVAEGSVLKLEGYTTLEPLKEAQFYVSNRDEWIDFSPICVTSFRNIETNVYGMPYIAMEYIKDTATDRKSVYKFKGEGDFSKIEDGIYQLYLWRGYKAKNLNIYKMGYDLGVGTMHHNTLIRVSNGKVSVLEYSQIQDKNVSAEKKMECYGTSSFLDASLNDFGFANRDPLDSSSKSRPLTEEEQAFIRKETLEIVANCSNDYERVKVIYEFICNHVYYDDQRPSSQGNNAALSNPYENLMAIRDRVDNNYNAIDGKVATNCVGYSALMAAMTRSLGIPTRIIEGVHLSSDGIWSDLDDLNTPNHHWTECYVDGQWIMVDANAGTQNHYDNNTAEWSYTGLSNYTFFDPTQQQLAANYLVKAVYVAEQQSEDTDGIEIVIEIQPKDVIAKAGNKVNFSVEATGVGLKYQWQIRTSKDGTWSNSTAYGSTGSSLTVSATQGRNGYQYRCKITDKNGTVKYTSAATLKIEK